MTDHTTTRPPQPRRKRSQRPGNIAKAARVAEITPEEREAALAAAREAIANRLAVEQDRQRREAIELDRERLGEWARRMGDLVARLPLPQTDHGRELVHRLRVRLGIVRNDLELAGVLDAEKK
jgi:hypothetical protein